MKKIWGIIVAVFTFILGLFLFERSKRMEAESELLQAEGDKKDSRLEQQQKDARLTTEKELADIEKEKQKKLSTKELEDYLKKI